MSKIDEIFTYTQFVFQQRKSTIECMLLLQSVIQKQSNTRHQLYCDFFFE